MTSTITQYKDGSWLYKNSEPFSLESGEYLPQWQLHYETFGELSKNHDNVILIHHALSVSSHVTSSESLPKKGWWQDIVGPGKAVDTDNYFVICINNLGSCFGSSGPLEINPENNKPWAGSFPQITINDMVASQKKLLLDMGIQKLYAIIGNSMGAMLSLTWAIEYANTVNRVMLISSSYKAYPANIANRNIQQELIRIDPLFNNGNYKPGTYLSGFRLARKLGLYTYRNASEWNRRFNSYDNPEIHDDEIISYMDYNSDVFCKAFDANSYLLLTRAMDLFNVTQKYDSQVEAFGKITAKTIVISVESDILFTPQQQQELYEGLQKGHVDCHFINHSSQFGHDTFLVETEKFGAYISDFLLTKSK